MTDVFVSYSRRDKDFVEKLVTELVQDGRDVWVDWEDIPRAADWLNEIDKGIEETTAFVFVVSRHSLMSEICNHELRYAFDLSKRVIPVIREDITGETDLMIKGKWAESDWGATATENWTGVSHLNWIFFKDDDDVLFETEFQALVDALDSDLDHIKTHTRILVREREWRTNAQKPSYLLGGEEISEAETWLAEADQYKKDPAPTDMHRQYIAKSRAVENERLENLRRLESRTRQFRIAAGVLAVAIVAAIIAAGVAIQQSTQAQNNAATADAEAAVARTDIADAEVRVVEAEQAVDSANATLTPIPPTLTQAAVDVADASNQVATAEGQLVIAEEQVATAQDQIATAEGQLVLAEVQVATAAVQVEIVEAELTSIPPTLAALDAQVSEAEQLVADLNLQALALNLGVSARESLNEDNVELASLLAIRSLNTEYTTGADSVLVSAANRLYTDYYLASDDTVFISDVDLNPDGRSLVYFDEFDLIFVNLKSGDSFVASGAQHDDSLTFLEYSDDGSFVMSVDFSGHIILWSTDDGSMIDEGQLDYVPEYITISPDGEAFAIAVGFDICIFEMDGFEEDYCFYIENEAYYGYGVLAFSPDGDYLALTAGLGALVYELNSNSADLEEEYFGHRFETTDVTFSPDGDYLLTGGADEQIILWDRESGEPSQFFDGVGVTNIVNTADFTPDGNYVVATTQDRIVRIWDIESGQIVRAMGGHTDSIISASVSTEQPLILTYSWDGSLRVWNIDLTSFSNVYAGHSDWVIELAFSDDGRFVASASDDFTIRVWDVMNQEQVAITDETDSYFGNLRFDPDDSNIVIWDTFDGNAIWDVEDDDLDFDDDGGYVQYEDDNSFIDYFVQTDDGEYAIFTENIYDDDFIESETNLVLRDLETDEETVLAVDEEGFIIPTSVDPIAGLIAWQSYDEDFVDIFTLYSITDDEILYEIELDLGFYDFMVAGAQGLIIAIDYDYNTVFMDLETGEILATVQEHSLYVTQIAVSPDGRLALTASDDETVIVWDLETLSPIRVYNNHTNPIYAAVFSPDSTYIASGGADRTVQVWSVDVTNLVDQVCATIVRDLTPTERERYDIDDTPTCE